MSTEHPTILITGGTGFAGSHLVEALLEQGQANIHVTTASGKETYLNRYLPADHFHQLDLTDANATTQLITSVQPDHVYHLAAYAAVGDSFEKTQEILHNNMVLQLSLLNAVKEHATDARVLVIGSAMEYDLAHLKSEAVDEHAPLGPISPYGVSKVLQDLLAYSYAQSYQLDIVRVRPFNHIGERQSPEFAVPAFAKQIVAIERGNQPILTVGNLEAIRDFTDVKDMVNAYIVLMNRGVTGEVYNVGSGQGHSMRSILDILIELAMVPISVEVDPQKLRPLDVSRAVADSSKIQQLGWQPTIDIHTTLARILEYWRQQP
jgi:GDP-4-dehydro-6-deoxy-D-mannose reductase